MSVNLSDVAALLFQDKTTVLAQPEVNHRHLSLSYLKDKDFQGKMQQKGYDFSEEMHALIYEIIEEEEYIPTLHESCVSICSTYKIHDHESIGHFIEGKKAIYPTIKGLQTFVDNFELGDTNKERIIVPNNDSQQLWRLLWNFLYRTNVFLQVIKRRVMVKKCIRITQPNSFKPTSTN